MTPIPDAAPAWAIAADALLAEVADRAMPQCPPLAAAAGHARRLVALAELDGVRVPTIGVRMTPRPAVVLRFDTTRRRRIPSVVEVVVDCRGAVRGRVVLPRRVLEQPGGGPLGRLDTLRHLLAAAEDDRPLDPDPLPPAPWSARAWAVPPPGHGGPAA